LRGVFYADFFTLAYQKLAVHHRKFYFFKTAHIITRNGHPEASSGQALPEVPCAEEIEQNGADLGELNKILLKKIEEMTLHMIRMQKELDILKSQK
jgi:hypothetical protein